MVGASSNALDASGGFEHLSNQTPLEQLAGSIPFGCAFSCDVVTAGQPREEHFTALAEAGVKVILDIRAEHEPRGLDEPGFVRATGMEYVALPVTSQTLGDAEFDTVRDMMSDTSKRPIVVHCQSANRVGAVLIPYLVLDLGLAPDAAIEEAVRAGLRAQELADIAFDYVNRQLASR